ncbi:MAG: DNA polymerase III subunit beta [Blastocatellia bacterium]|nr:DNA polymerase III subunit beta [Blastocatellia bacterium]
MEFTVKKSTFQKELGFVQGVIEKKNTIPVLQNIMVRSKGTDSIEIVATDLDISIYCRCEAEVKKEGAMLIHAKKLFDIVRSLPDSTVHFQKDEQSWALVKCERSKFRVVGQSEDNFPNVPEMRSHKVIFPAKSLHYLIEHTIFAITQEESQRYALNGAQFVLSKNFGRMITTDGHRLAFVESKNMKIEDGEDLKVLIPRKTLTELLKMSADGFEKKQSDSSKESKEATEVVDVDVMFGKDENHLFFQIGPRVLISRTLSGQFPNYELVMPKEINHSMVFDSDKFSSAIRRAALMADEKIKGVKVRIVDANVEITARSSEVGDATETLDVDYNGPEINLGFNSQYLLDFLQTVGSEQIYFELKDTQSQAQMRPKDVEDYYYKYVVMPMRI